MPDYLTSARRAYKSHACRDLCINTLLLLWPDTGQHRSPKKIFRDGNEGNKIKLSFFILRTK